MEQYIHVKKSGVPWAETIPASWSVRRGKTILTLLNRPIREDDEIITCFRDGEVTLRKNRREDGFTVALQENGYQGIEPGDLVVHGMDGFAGSIGISDSRGKATPVLNVMESTQHKKYLMYYLRALAYKDVFMSLSTGIRVRSCDLRWNKLAVLPFILPPIAEQKAIATYLDDQVSQIDFLVGEAKASVEDYKKWKSSVIFEAVTKGLDAAVCMKDSNATWIGKIPSHWRILPIKRIVNARDGGAWGEEPAGESNDRICMRVADFDFEYGVFKHQDEEMYTKRKYSASQIEKLTLSQGDILVEKSGGGEKTPVGRAVLFDLEVPALYANFMDRIRVDADVVLPTFFEYYWQAMYYLAITKIYIKQTTGIQNLNIASLLEKEVIVFPDLSEQNQIVQYLNDFTDKVRDLVSEKESLISDLEVYKRSLIYETVTGKRKVVS